MNQTLEQFDHPAAWTSTELSERKEEWVYRLTHDDLTELDLALQSLQTRGLVIPNFGKDDFPVPKLIAKLEPMIERLDTGLGILQITGLSREKYSKDQASTLFWGLGAYIGRPWEQNAKQFVKHIGFSRNLRLNDASITPPQRPVRLLQSLSALNLPSSVSKKSPSPQTLSASF